MTFYDGLGFHVCSSHGMSVHTEVVLLGTTDDVEKFILLFCFIRDFWLDSFSIIFHVRL